MFPILSLLLWPMVACDPSEPVLTGVVTAAGAEERGLTTRAPQPYVKEAGVYVDVGYLCGRTLDAVRDELQDQMGDVRESRDLNPKDGQEQILERGKIRVKDGRIYMIHVTFDGPLRRSTALQAVGLPATVRKWNSFTHEFNTRHHAGFERIRVGRLDPGDEAVGWIEVMKASPRH